MSYNEPTTSVSAESADSRRRSRPLLRRPRAEPSPAGDVPRAARDVARRRPPRHGPRPDHQGSGDGGVPPAGGVLVGGHGRHAAHGLGAPAHPPADRPARPPEVPQDPRPALRAAADGGARRIRRRAGQRPHRRVRRAGRVRLRQGLLGAAPVAGVPHAAGPAAVRPRTLPAVEGRHHPARPRRRQAARPRRRRSPTRTRPGSRSTTTSTGSSTSARSSAGATC